MEAYLHCVLTCTSISTLEKETKKIKKDKLQTGDLFLDVATGGAAVVVDVCVNERREGIFTRKGRKARKTVPSAHKSGTRGGSMVLRIGITVPVCNIRGRI